MEMEMDDERSFFRRVKKINLDQRYLIVPQEFVKSNPECFTSDHITVQKHPGSTPWHMTISVRGESGGGVELSSGWGEFVAGNNIEHGDIIIFRLAQGSIFTFDVYDPDGLEKPPQRANPMALASAVAVQPLGVKNEAVSDSEGGDSAYDELPDSEASLSRSQVHKSFTIQLSMLYIMYVPVPHHMNFPDEKASIVLEDPWKREWAVKWNPEIRQLTKGLVTFLRANDIRVGDSILLEPIRVGRLKARKLT